MKLAFLLIFSWTLAAAQDVPKITHGIEQRYNMAKTLQVNFTETLTGRGGRHIPQTGTLYLKKPGKMLWLYNSTKDKFFLSDGTFTYDYDPGNHRVERGKLKESDDNRGPLAFLLGKVDFDRDFGSYETGNPDGSITAIPKSKDLPYTQISFIAGPDYSLKELSIKAQDGSVLDYVFDQEVLNPPLSDSMFKFTAPAGAVVFDAARPGQ